MTFFLIGALFEYRGFLFSIFPPFRFADGRKVRTDLREIGWEGVDWMHLAQDRNRWRALVNTVKNLWVP
jgi:hypothetical protein